MIIEDRQGVEGDIEQTLGLVPEFFRRVPDYLLPTEWASFKSLELSDQTAIPNEYKELIGLAVSGATRCRYCCYFHTEAARLFGATEDEITETALIAKNTMGWSTYLNTLQFDYDEFVREVRSVDGVRPRPHGGRRARLRWQGWLAPAANGGQPPASGPVVSLSRARSNSPRTRSKISIASAGGCSGAPRIASNAIRAPATRAESSWLVAVTVNMFSRDRSIRTRTLSPRRSHGWQRLRGRTTEAVAGRTDTPTPTATW